MHHLQEQVLMYSMFLLLSLGFTAWILFLNRGYVKTKPVLRVVTFSSIIALLPSCVGLFIYWSI